MSKSAERKLTRALTGIASLSVVAGFALDAVAQDKIQADVFIGPTPIYDSIQMAESQGFLDLTSSSILLGE